MKRLKVNMKIATWNVERLKHRSALGEITGILEALEANVLVLTETDRRIHPANFRFMISTPGLTEVSPGTYRETENRVTIFSNYEITDRFPTCDPYTSLCVGLKTELGFLKVYGTIIGIFGNRNNNFNTDLEKQLSDFDKLATEQNLCVVGDYNISFSDNYYFTTSGRNRLLDSFNKNKLKILTHDVSNCIDHIAFSSELCSRFSFVISEWNTDSKLSDHNGVCVKFII